MTEVTTEIDTGTAYGRPTPSHDASITEVGPGTPMGEVMRRYWHPIASADALTSDLPHRTRVLGENLIVFRDKSGRPGVVAERCKHRGSSLFYGRIEEDGIRCCYHGWKFDVQGHCLEQPCEPELGKRRDAARQPWYPVEEAYGLVFVYMGPPERKPPLPRWDNLDPAEEGDQYFASWPVPGAEVTGLVQDFNWLQLWENALDATHVMWLHHAHSGHQLTGTGEQGLPFSFYDPYRSSEVISYHKTEWGGAYHQRFDMPTEDGQTIPMEWRLENQLPNLIALPDFTIVQPDSRHNLMIWAVPSDDTTHRLFFAVRGPDPSRMYRLVGGITQAGKAVWELTPEISQRYPSDNEAQASQGPITFHSEETLATSDKGVVMLRRMLKKMVEDVEAGRDPIGAGPEVEPVRHVESGVFTVSGDEGATAAKASVTAGG